MTTNPVRLLHPLLIAGALAVLATPSASGQSSPSEAPAPPAAARVAETRETRPAAGDTAAAAPRPTAGGAATADVRPTSGRTWADQEYRLGPGDKLRVEVYGEPQLSQSLQVRPDGKITLPLAGDLQAAGRTSIEVRDALTASLKEYVTNPVVTVIVTDALAPQIYVIGEVAMPGAQLMQGPINIMQALAKAGGLKEFANRSDIRVLRTVGTGSAQTSQTLSFDYKEAIKGRAPSLQLIPGDTVLVP